jgi:hypothetical protein
LHENKVKSFFLFLILAQLSLSGCVTVHIPDEEYNYARAAMDAAKDAESPRYASGLWYKGEEAYKDAERLYNDRRYPDAEKRFLEAKANFEKAENAARIARFQSGDTSP